MPTSNNRGSSTKISTTSIKSSHQLADNVQHADLSNITDIGQELDSLRSQIKRLIRYDEGGNWFDEQVLYRAISSTNEFKLGSDTDIVTSGGAVKSESELLFDDQNRAAGGWAGPLKLSSSPSNWEAVEEIFQGEKSILEMVHSAAVAGVRSKFIVQVSTLEAGTLLTIPNANWGTSTDNYVDVMLNGQLLRGGASPLFDVGAIDYTLVGTSGIKFAFPIEDSTYVVIIVHGGSVLGSVGSSGGGPSVYPATTVAASQVFNAAPSVGTSVKYAREDHTHGTPPTPELPQPSPTVVESILPGQAPSAGSALHYARADHVHGTPPTPTHGDLAGKEWTSSGHVSDPLKVPIFDIEGNPATVMPPDDGDREGKVLAWLSNNVIGWARFVPGIMAISINFDKDMIFDMPNLETTPTAIFTTLPGRMVEDNDVVADYEILDTSSYLTEIGDEII